MSTEFPTKSEIKREWHLIDAQDLVLGKLASKAAMILMGKTKPTYTTFMDTGDHVIVINAAKVKVTGRKEEDKMYRHFTGYPGGLVEKSLKRGRAEKPIRDHMIVINAAKVKVTGRKEEDKMYRHFTGYPGGLVEKSLKRVRAEKPIRLVEDAISGMLPKTKLGKQMFRKLNVYAGETHPHAAQQPVALTIK